MCVHKLYCRLSRLCKRKDAAEPTVTVPKPSEVLIFHYCAFCKSS